MHVQRLCIRSPLGAFASCSGVATTTSLKVLVLRGCCCCCCCLCPGAPTDPTPQGPQVNRQPVGGGRLLVRQPTTSVSIPRRLLLLLLLLLLRRTANLGFRVNDVTKAQQAPVMRGPSAALDPRLRKLSIRNDRFEAPFVCRIPVLLSGFRPEELPYRFLERSSPRSIRCQLR